MKKLVSIDLKSDFGFFRKPDINNTVYQTYNMLHRPAVLGILGAILGLDGYKEQKKMPQYFEKLQDLKVGIEPLFHEKGNYQKTVIKYNNTVGYANKSANGTLNVEETTLIKPSYRVYVLLELDTDYHSLLYEYLQKGKAEFLPYFGKNEFSAWWDGFKPYDFQFIEKPLNDINIKSIFLKKDVVKEHKAEPIIDFNSFWENDSPFMYFERLPKGFDTISPFQYDMGDFVFTTFTLKQSLGIDNLYFLNNEQYYVQLI